MDVVRETYAVDSVGRYLEDYEPSEVIHHWPGRTLTDFENQMFTLMTGNQSSAHLDRVEAAERGHPDMLVNGGFLLALVHGLSTRELSAGPKAIYHLGLDDVKILRPSYPGDTITASTQIVSTRPSESQPDRGILTVETWAENERGERVIQFRRSIMVWRRGHGPDPRGTPS